MNIPLIAPYIDLLRGNRQYRWLWLSQVVSLLGDWFNLIAATTLVSTLTGSGLAISGLFAARLLPPFILGPVVGVVADRYDRRKILITSDILRIFVVLGFLLVDSPANVWLLYALTVLQLSISAFFEPTRSALMPSIVAEENLVTANALDSTTWSSMLAIGAALGGLATVLFGITAAFIIDAMTFALSAWFVYQITVPEAERVVSTNKQNGLNSYLEGLRYLWSRRHILILTLVKAVSALSFGAMDIVQVQFAENIFPIGEDSAGTLGLIYTVIGLGTGLGPLIAVHYSGEKRKAMLNTITVAFVLTVVGYMALAWSPTLMVFLLATLIRTGGTGIAWVYSSALLQMTVPRGYRGRVFAFDMAMFTLASASSIIWAGFALDSLGLSAREVAFISGVIAMVILGGWLVYSLLIYQKAQFFNKK